MVLTLVLMFATQAATVASTPAEVLGPILYDQIRLGMTKEQVKAVKPAKAPQISEGCFVDIYPRYKNDKLSSLHIEWGGGDKAEARCGLVVQQLLATKYGEPLRTGQKVEIGDCGSGGNGVLGALSALCSATGGDTPQFSSKAHWERNGVAMDFTLDVDSEGSKWSLDYNPAQVVSDAAASKF